MVRTFAKILLVNERGELLLLRRSDSDNYRPGGPDFPGGTVEAGEDPYDGVVRETREETGVDVRDARLVFAAPRVGAYGTGTWLLYMARVSDDVTITVSGEHSGYEWLLPGEVLARGSHPPHEDMLRFMLAHDAFNPAAHKTVTCRTLVTNEAGELLLLRRSATDPFHAGLWDLPGGQAEPAERLGDTAARELAEETGLTDAGLTLVYGTSNPRRTGTGTWLFYRAQVPVDTAITLSDEHDTYQWIPAADLPAHTDYDVLLRMHAFVTAHRLFA